MFFLQACHLKISGRSQEIPFPPPQKQRPHQMAFFFQAFVKCHLWAHGGTGMKGAPPTLPTPKSKNNRSVCCLYDIQLSLNVDSREFA